MKKTYESPEAVVVLFEQVDLLTMSSGDEGEKVDLEW